MPVSVIENIENMIFILNYVKRAIYLVLEVCSFSIKAFGISYTVTSFYFTMWSTKGIKTIYVMLVRTLTSAKKITSNIFW